MSPCIEWTGSLSHNGYGQHSWNGRMHRAHRVAWIKANGPILEGLCVLHECDNRACINVEHLHLGTPADNARERNERNRQAAGERHARAKLTADQVREIRRRRSAGETQASITRDYPVSLRSVRNILDGQSWKSVA